MTDSVRCVLRGCKKLSKQFSYSDLLRCSRFGLGVQSPLPTFEDGIGFKALVQDNLVTVKQGAQKRSSLSSAGCLFQQRFVKRMMGFINVR